MTKLGKVNPSLNFIKLQFMVEVLLSVVLVLTSVVEDTKEPLKTKFSNLIEMTMLRSCYNKLICS